MARSTRQQRRRRREKRQVASPEEQQGELKKVEWPNQRQVLTGTVVVIIACAIVGFYLYLADLALQPFVQRLLLGG